MLTDLLPIRIGACSGPMAEWLRRGLQILARRFDSGSGLHTSSLFTHAAVAQACLNSAVR
ncbi:MAG: hypothetical protein JWM38_576 [Sphingomonas bacterium]|jgi:hypothetical protein|nr:hypothetical protein [Sphingomonas bacterium]MDB5684320.1 hypothetical protein [Sphingomonas bacterium]MDB5717149.1 hypothetical protein [Sphingomonas bacterium]